MGTWAQSTPSPSSRNRQQEFSRPQATHGRTDDYQGATEWLGPLAAFELTPEPFGCETVTAECRVQTSSRENTRNGDRIEISEPFYLVAAAFDYIVSAVAIHFPNVDPFH